MTASDQPSTDGGNSPTLIRVALVEDNRLVREGIVSVLQRFEDIRIVASEPRGLDVGDEAMLPDVILLDVGIEAGDSLEIARRIIEDVPEAGVIVMDLLAAADDLLEFIAVGVAGFIMKDAPLDEVVRTIRAVAAGTDVLPEAMTATLFSEIAREATESPSAAGYTEGVRLTPREREVIELIAEGMSNKAIARGLDISIHTVKSHLRNIMDKLNLHSRLQLARYVDEVEQEGLSAE